MIMTIRTCSLLLLALFLAAAAGCGKSQKKTVVLEEPPDREMPSRAPDNRTQPGLPEAIPPAGENIPSAEEGTRFGYRVQVAAYTASQTAEQKAEELRTLFSEPVYVVPEGLLFKIQVGDFVNRDRAQAVRRKAIDIGMDGAFVVDTMIREP
ncbi:MAG: hypothetical protein GF355_15900 [Candidatus Eisenbacteria bacterium]|nr:hypothetical protein [Candidatus Eisenbacteria bacterium]